MELRDFATLISKKKMTIFLIVIIFLILALILTIIQPFKYGSSAQILIIQNSVNPDPYSASKSTEYLSNILAEVTYSNSFFENVLNSGYFIDKSYFGQSVKDQMKIWDKTISAKAVNNSGIISINVYHKDRAQAELIARAAVYTLQTKHNLYHGGGDNVAMKVIDEPITSNYPVKPNLILNFGLALVLGFIFAGVYIYLFPEEKYNIGPAPKFFEKNYNKKLENKINEPAGFYHEPLYHPTEPEIAFKTVAREAPITEYGIKNHFDSDYDGDDLDSFEQINNRGNIKNVLNL